MKNMRLLLAVLLMFAGCSYGKQHVESMLDNPPRVFEDPLYVDYQQQLDALESRYLNQEISYAEYVEKKGDLEDQYTQEADRRQEIVEGN